MRKFHLARVDSTMGPGDNYFVVCWCGIVAENKTYSVALVLRDRHNVLPPVKMKEQK